MAILKAEDDKVKEKEAKVREQKQIEEAMEASRGEWQVAKQKKVCPLEHFRFGSIPSFPVCILQLRHSVSACVRLCHS